MTDWLTDRGVALIDTQSDSIQCLNFAKNYSIQYSIQYYFTKIQFKQSFNSTYFTNIQFKTLFNFLGVGDSIQMEIEFNEWGSTAFGWIMINHEDHIF